MDKGTNYVGPKKIWVPKSQIVSVACILHRKRPSLSYCLDSGCLGHMAGKRFMFLYLKPDEEIVVSFVGISKGKISGIGKIGIPSLTSIDNVLYVKGLK